MAKVTYFFNHGLPCSLSTAGVSGVTLREALTDFAAFRDESERIGNHWRDAYLDVLFDIPSGEPCRTYVFGPRGGIKQLQE